MLVQHSELYLINEEQINLYKMIVIEDDELWLGSLKRIFEKTYYVDLCKSAEEFLAKYFNNHYDIIIMDISLRGSIDGLELTKKLKQNSPHSNTPIICLTAHALTKDARNAKEAGVDLYIRKPVPIEYLKETEHNLIMEKTV